MEEDLFDRPAAWRLEAACSLDLSGEDLIAGLVTGAGYPDALVPAAVAFGRAGGPVVDLGAGLGAATTWLAARAGVAVVGVEPEPRAALLAARAFESPPLVVGTATAAPLRSASFWGVALLGVVSLVNDLGGVLNEAARLLRPGAALAISDLCAVGTTELRPDNAPNVFRSVENLADTARKRGFVLEDIWRAPTARCTAWDEVSARVDEEIERRNGSTEAFAQWRADRDRIARLIGDGALEVATLSARFTPDGSS